MRKIYGYLALAAFALIFAGCASTQNQGAVQMPARIQGPVLVTVPTVPTTFMQSVGEAVDPAACTMLGTGIVSVVATSAAVAGQSMLFGGVGGEFVCTLVKAMFAPKPTQVQVQ